VIQSKRIKWTRHAAYIRENRNAYMILVTKSEGKRALGRSRGKWKYITNIHRKELGWKSTE
jgi:hypothetical protein